VKEMITEQGVVEKVWGRKAVIRIQKSSACAHCDSRGACQVMADKAVLIEVANDLDAKEGDRVELSVPASSLTKLSLLVYFLPIVALLGGAYAGQAGGHLVHLSPTVGAIVGGFLAMGAAFFGLRRLDRRAAAKGEYHPRMTRILRGPESAPAGDPL
jgi:sigma-E factor negative regulatory protein RseC